MYLVKTLTEGVAVSATAGETEEVGGLAAWLLRWWRQKSFAERRRAARKQMWLVESMTLGPKQRVVLLRCGDAQFLVGTGPEGIQSIVPVGAGSTAAELAVVHAMEGPRA